MPAWSVPPKHEFHLEVLKNGTIIDDIALPLAKMIVGRHPAVELTMENPSISRQHAVFQFSEDGNCYLFDVGSTHGSFINKKRCGAVSSSWYNYPLDLHHYLAFIHRAWIASVTAGKYYHVNVGDVIKFGSSSRLFIFQGPAELLPEEYVD